MKKITVTLLSFAILVGFLVVVQSEASNDQSVLRSQIQKLTQEVSRTMNGVGNQQISLSQAKREFEVYASEAQTIYEKARSGNTSTFFVKISAGFSLSMDIYVKGLEEMNPDKIKAGTALINLLTSQMSEHYGL